MEVACAEDDGAEAVDVFGRERRPAGEADLDGRAAAEVQARQAGRESRGIVGDDKIAGAQVVDQAAARACARWRPCESTTSSLACGGRCTGCAAAIMAAPCAMLRRAVRSRREVSGRLSVALSAPGIARAWSGVSMSPGSRDRKRTPAARLLLVPDAGQVAEGGFAGAVGAPCRIGGDRGIARDVEDDRAAPLACGRGERAQQRLGQPERADEVGGEGPLQVFAVGIAKRRQGYRAEVGRIVDQHVQAAEFARDLHARCG